MKDLKSLVAPFSTFSPRQLEMQQGKSCLLQLAAQEFSTKRQPVSTLSTNSWGHTRKMTFSWDLCFARGVGVKNAALLHPQRTRSAVPQCAVSSELPKTQVAFYQLPNTQILFFELGLRWAGLSFSPWEAFSVNPVVLHHFCACGTTLPKPHHPPPRPTSNPQAADIPLGRHHVIT